MDRDLYLQLNDFIIDDKVRVIYTFGDAEPSSFISVINKVKKNENISFWPINLHYFMVQLIYQNQGVPSIESISKRHSIQRIERYYITTEYDYSISESADTVPAGIYQCC